MTLYVSDMKWARQTAACVAAHVPSRIVLEPALRERHLDAVVDIAVTWLRECALFLSALSTIACCPMLSGDGRWYPWYTKWMAGPEERALAVSRSNTLSVLFDVVEQLDAIQLWGRAGRVSLLQMLPDGKRAVAKLGDMSNVGGQV